MKFHLKSDIDKKLFCKNRVFVWEEIRLRYKSHPLRMENKYMMVLHKEGTY